MTAEASAPRATMKEICSEFLGTLVLMLFGLAVNAQVTAVSYTHLTLPTNREV